MVVTVNEINSYIKMLKKNKSAGPDNLSSENFIYASNRLNIYLSFLFTSIFRYSVIPHKFMKVFIVPLIKDKCGNLNSKDNYRPISLACVISKLFERSILDKCKQYLITNDNQFAFKKHHNTSMCVLALKQILFEYTNKSTPIYACFLDISKAFDRINNDKLINILKERNVPVFILGVLIYWFCNQLFYVRWQNTLLDSFNPTCGLRQGSVISPIFFSVYMEKCSDMLNKSNCGCYFNTVLINHIIYADDMVIFSPSLKGLQNLIDICVEFGKIFDLKFNLNKSKCMVFSSNYKIKEQFVYMKDKRLEIVENYEYLGVNINCQLKDDIEIENIYRKLCCKANVINRKFSKCSISVKNELFRAYCTNIYCVGLLAKYKKCSFSKLRICYNNSFRIIHRYPRWCSASEMFTYNNVMSFNEVLRASQWRDLCAALESSNSLVKATISIRSSLLWQAYETNLFR